MYTIIEALPITDWKTVDQTSIDKIYLSIKKDDNDENEYSILHALRHGDKYFFWHVLDQSFTKCNGYTGPGSEGFSTLIDAIMFCFTYKRTVYEFDNFLELSKFIVSQSNS